MPKAGAQRKVNMCGQCKTYVKLSERITCLKCKNILHVHCKDIFLKGLPSDSCCKGNLDDSLPNQNSAFLLLNPIPVAPKVTDLQPFNLKPSPAENTNGTTSPAPHFFHFCY